MPRVFGALIALTLLVASLSPPAQAANEQVVSWWPNLYSCPGTSPADKPADPKQVKVFGVDGYCIAWRYYWSGTASFDFCQVRFSVNGVPETQYDRASCSVFSLVAHSGSNYVFKVQGCYSGLFGSDCTAWYENDQHFAPRPTPTPEPPAPPPAPLPQPTPRYIRLPHLPTPTPTPLPLWGIAAPQVLLGVRTRLQCQRYANDPSAKADCLSNVAAGKIFVSWQWNREPCAAQNCYAADAYVVSTPGGGRFTFDAAQRNAWVPASNDDQTCVAVAALHNLPTLSGTGEACPTMKLPPGQRPS